MGCILSIEAIGLWVQIVLQCGNALLLPQENAPLLPVRVAIWLQPEAKSNRLPFFLIFFLSFQGKKTV